MKKFHREDLHVAWSVTGDDAVSIVGHVRLKTDPIRREPRLLIEVGMDVDLLDSLPLCQLIPLCEERMQCDLNEINGEGYFTEEDAKKPDVMKLRELLEAP